jgi:hypothetical protein
MRFPNFYFIFLIKISEYFNFKIAELAYKNPTERVGLEKSGRHHHLIEN